MLPADPKLAARMDFVLDQLVDFDAGFSADNRLNVLGAFLAHETLRGGRWAPYTDTLGEPTSPAYAVARGALGGEAAQVVAARRAKAAYHASSYASRRLAAVAGDNLEFASMLAGAFTLSLIHI